MYSFWLNQSSSTTTSTNKFKKRIFLCENYISGYVNYNGGNGGEMKRMNEVLSNIFIHNLNYSYLNMYEISNGKYDFYDGNHLKSITSRMSGMILLNMLCYT